MRWLKIDDDRLLNEAAIAEFQIDEISLKSLPEITHAIYALDGRENLHLVFAGSELECQRFFKNLEKYLSGEGNIIRVCDIPEFIDD
ncbi:hypothetical protein [Roseofilum sp. Belize Diploria]|uniref:hypothetical protein n=1 Tax=Roseofilum sp. Belize Diploria TaxID=2821501 RepID=UPI001B1064F2|nr:hypothetical protein [Roseofilum sp. Belize Diploria]MBP0008058.1 hypothetical protein [Roseofilum sp. Belize Diploria]